MARQPVEPSSAAPGSAAATAPPRLSAAATARLSAIRGASGSALCELVPSVDDKRDAPIIGQVLELAHKRRRSEQDRDCFFDLSRAMQANQRLAGLAHAATTETRWLAILAWAGRNLRAKHFGVYLLALDRMESNVRLSAVAQLARHHAGPKALKVLEKALADELAAVRLRAVRAGGAMDHPAVGKYLRARQKVETDKAVMAALKRVLSR